MSVKPIKTLLITLEGDIKYEFGIDKDVSEVVKEIRACKNDFYQVMDTCAIKKSKIFSVENHFYTPKEEEKELNTNEN